MSQTRLPRKNKATSSANCYGKATNIRYNREKDSTEYGLEAIRSQKQIRQYETVAIKLGLMPKSEKRVPARTQNKNNATKISNQAKGIESLKTCYREQKQKQNISRQVSTAGSTRKSMGITQNYDFANPFQELVVKVSKTHHELPCREQLNGILSHYLLESSHNINADGQVMKNNQENEIEQYVGKTQVKLNQVFNKYGQPTNS